MLIKTQTLKGLALDWAVCKVLGETTGEFISWDGKTLVCAGMIPDGVVSCPEGAYDVCINKLRYSRNWKLGGPLLSKFKIDIYHHDTGAVASIPIHKDGQSWTFDWDGKTELKAAMMCLVMSELGETIDVPIEIYQELLQ